MSSTVLNTLRVVTYLIFTSNLAGRYNYYSHFQAQRDQIASLGSHRVTRSLAPILDGVTSELHT